MAREYCKVLVARGITPRVFSRNLDSKNVESFLAAFPELEVQQIEKMSNEIGNWLVCTNIESHEEICGRLTGRVYCEKPYAHTPDYDTDKNVLVLMNRRYYYWVRFIKEIIDSGKIVKVIAVIPEKSVDALITQSIHVVDLLWYLVGPFQGATSIGDSSPSYMLSSESDIPLIINMNYGSHENFSLRFYADGGVVHEAKPLEAFNTAIGMEVREPDDDVPVRSYKPVVTALDYTPGNHKPGLAELVDDLMSGSPTRLPDLFEHRRIHAWMQENMT